MAIPSKAKAGKSLLGVELAAALATGRPVLGQLVDQPMDVWTGGSGGSSAKNDYVDIVWRLTADHDVVTLRQHTEGVSWVPEEVTLRRSEEPLTHRWIEDAWPAFTADVAGVLDAMGVPVDASDNVAAAALRGGGCGRRKSVVLAALRFRRSGNHLGAGIGNHDGNRPGEGR